MLGKSPLHTVSLASITILLAACGKPGATSGFTNEGKVQLNQESIAQAEASTISAGTELTVVLKDGCEKGGAISGAITNRYTGQTASGVRSYSWKAPRDLTQKELAKMAEEDSCVDNIASSLYSTPSEEPAPQSDQAVQALPSDPSIASAKHLAALGAADAYNVFYNPQTGIRSSQVVIAIIDSGVNIYHEDLRQNIWINHGEVPNNGIDDDRNGYIDDVYGYNFASRIGSPVPQRTAENAAWQWAHGTKVAGLAAATGNNGRGAAGIAYTAKIMALNNMGGAAGMSQSDTANAIRYAVDNGADVINLSLGGFSAVSADYRNALLYAVRKGVPVFAAAGNESSLIDSNYSAAGQAASTPGIVSVGNFQAGTMQKAPGSNYSTTYVLLGAPGTYTSYEQLYTTAPDTNSSYCEFGGTSAATPVAAGGAALAIGLLKARGYSYSAAEISSLLQESASQVPALSRYFRNGNALNLANLARLMDARYPAR